MATGTNIEALKGTWDYMSGENYDEILKELEVDALVRAVIETIKPRVIIDEKNGKWSLKSVTNTRTKTTEFTPGVEFEDVAPFGKEITTIIQFENGKWIERVHYKNGKDLYIERWVNDQGQLQVIKKIGNIGATRLFKRVN